MIWFRFVTPCWCDRSSVWLESQSSGWGSGGPQELESGLLSHMQTDSSSSSHIPPISLLVSHKAFLPRDHLLRLLHLLHLLSLLPPLCPSAPLGGCGGVGGPQAALCAHMCPLKELFLHVVFVPFSPRARRKPNSLLFHHTEPDTNRNFLRFYSGTGTKMFRFL